MHDSAKLPATTNFADPIRSRGHRGGVIPMHRALAHFRLGPMNLVTSISLFFFFSAIWLVLLPRLCRFWSQLLAWSLPRLPLHASLDLNEYHLSSFRLQIPYLRMEPVLPTPSVWILTCVVTLLLFAITSLVPRKLMPVTYLTRAILLIQASALLYFALWPLHFKHSPDSYIEALVNSGIGLISIVPLLFALTYYIFDFGLWKKAVLTALTMTHLAIFLPFQVLVQALILQKSVLFMPLLYIVFGIALDVMLIIAFYSWGMSWHFRSATE
ncbi:MAG TPA: hypothetical protein VEH30_17795 [Terriglobales bacterium]|nr:hypothetical protein [Terriglobales bacterium]